MFQSRIAAQGPMAWMDFPEVGSTVESLQSWLAARMYEEPRVSILPDGTPILLSGPWQFREKPEMSVLQTAMALFAIGAEYISDPDILHRWFVDRWNQRWDHRFNQSYEI